MTESSRIAIRAIISGDPLANEAEKSIIFSALSGDNAKSAHSRAVPYSEAAQRLGVCRDYISKLCNAGKLTPIFLGKQGKRSYFVTDDSLNRLLAGQG